MVQAIIKLENTADRILTIVKGKYGLKNKSDAINLVINKFAENLLEPELKPEYIEELNKVSKGKHKKFSSVTDLRRLLENTK